MIIVRKEEIDQARLVRGQGCPIQRAVSRVFGRTALVAYETEWDSFAERHLRGRVTVGTRSWLLPESAVDFMRNFDQGLNVRPISFPVPNP